MRVTTELKSYMCTLWRSVDSTGAIKGIDKAELVTRNLPLCACAEKCLNLYRLKAHGYFKISFEKKNSPICGSNSKSGVMKITENSMRCSAILLYK